MAKAVYRPGGYNRKKKRNLFLGITRAVIVRWIKDRTTGAPFVSANQYDGLGFNLFSQSQDPLYELRALAKFIVSIRK
jgi:hypothetical protein